MHCSSKRMLHERTFGMVLCLALALVHSYTIPWHLVLLIMFYTGTGESRRDKTRRGVKFSLVWCTYGWSHTYTTNASTISFKWLIQCEFVAYSQFNLPQCCFLVAVGLDTIICGCTSCVDMMVTQITHLHLTIP